MIKMHLIALATSLISPALFAQEAEDTVPASMDCSEAVTVFQDVSRMGRKDRAAKNITQMHERMARDGWNFIGLDVYTENNDLEGFYLSYTRPAACSADSEPE